MNKKRYILLTGIFLLLGISEASSQSLRWKKECEVVPIKSPSRLFLDRNDQLFLYSRLEHGILKSTDDGRTWQRIDTTVSQSISGLAVEFGSGGVVSSVKINNKKVELDQKKWWLGNKKTLLNDFPGTLCFTKSNKIFMVFGTGLLTSDDSGKHFYPVDVFNKRSAKNDMDSIALDENLFRYYSDQRPTNVFIDWLGHVMTGSEKYGIFYSTNEGRNWRKFNKGLQDTSIINLTANRKGQIFALTKSGGIYSWYKLIKKKDISRKK